MRRFFVGLLVLLSALLVLLSSTSLWVRRHVINTGVFVSTTQTIIHEPAVQTRVADRVTQTVMATPRAQQAVQQAVGVLPPGLQSYRPTVENGLQALVSRGVSTLLASDAFTALTSAAMTSAHSQLVAGQPVQFTLGQAKARIPDSAKTGLAGQVLGLIPDNVGITLITPADAPRLYNAIDVLKVLWLWVGLAGFALLAWALWLSRYRRGTVRAWAITLTVLCLAILVTLRVARGQVIAMAKPVNRDAVGAVYGVIAGSLRAWDIWLIVIALVVVAVTLMWGRVGVVPATRRGWAAYRSQAASRAAEQRAVPVGATPSGVPLSEATLSEGTVPGDGASDSSEGSAGKAATAATAAAAHDRPWYRRVAAGTSAFVAGTDVGEHVTRLGGAVREHRRPVQWAGVVVAAIVLLFWPSPTLSVLIWVAAIVALYLGVLEWLQSRAPQGTPQSAPGAVDEAPPAAAAPAAVAATGPSGSSDGPSQPAEEAALVNDVGERLDLILRLGAARDSGLLTDEEFRYEKGRLLPLTR